ncbi:transglutaminase-like domain-containing protein [Paracoccus tibetensis]|uniref:Transglutaminase-like enzyme, putative cysteine protease n=1 Tax=Paracoccus tibetensis TaxID=336292 RepID=A0A1G5GRU6_9RHOB|nr:transglutaminase family protein [Paracoccus tibetensis]SCY54131.1 Transglutaminase-like enzyme, putative cysteine protease [Paracoccus tibetensis]
MLIRFGFEIGINAPTPVPLILALSPHSSVPGRILGANKILTEPAMPVEEFIDPFGNRRARLVLVPGRSRLWSDDVIELDGQPDVFNWNARQHEIAHLPPETLPFLTASRYCDSDLLTQQAWDLFGSTQPGWARVQAISNYVHNHLTFGYKFGRPTKTASHAMSEATGVCRDFAHLAITLCRAMNIPARYASGYLGDVGVPPSGPGDFCAWFEAYLEDRWYTFDARYNTPRIGRVLMVRGRDAADGAMITSFGRYTLETFRVWTDELPDEADEAAVLTRLARLPDAPALTLAMAGTS